MALIKCEECGKEFSDKANACPNCACPVKIEPKVKNNNENEYIISEAIISKKLILKYDLIIVVGVFIVLFLFMYGLSNQAQSAFMFSSLITFFLIVVLAIEGYLLLKNKLILTNKRVNGKIYGILSSSNIDIPIDKINAIVITKKLFVFDGISIMSAFAQTYHLLFVENAQDFREKVMEKIDTK